MKKILLFFILLLVPSVVLADGIDDYYINATILSNGDLEVEEYFSVTGEYNGFERIIEYKNQNSYPFNPNTDSYGGSEIHNGSGIRIISVKAVNANEDFTFDNVNGDEFTKVFNAEKGDYGVYTLSSSYYGSTVRIYLPSHKNKAFYIKYVIENMAILHNDVGELGWNAVGKELSESIENLHVTINIPGNQNDIRVWGHGPYSGNTSIISKEQVEATIDYLSPNTAVDVRVTFDKEVILNSSKTTNVDALDKIILYEEDEAQKANYQRQQEDFEIIERIEKNFYYLNTEPSRYSYDITQNSIGLLYDTQKKDEFLKTLYTFKPKVDDYEYNYFSDILKEEKNFENYSKAKRLVNNVFSEELKTKMNKELKEYQEIISVGEDEREIRNIIITAVGIVLSFVAAIYNKIKVGFLKNIDPMYYRDIPKDIKPAEAGILTDKTLGRHELSAMLLDLIRRKFIIITPKEDGSYDLEKAPDKYALLDNDRTVMELIFKGKSKVNSKRISKISNGMYESWKVAVTRGLKRKSIIEQYHDDPPAINLVLIIIGVILLLTKYFYVGFLFLFIGVYDKYKKHTLLWMIIPMNVYLIILSLTKNNFNHISIAVSIIAIIIVKMVLRKIPREIAVKPTKEGKEEINKLHGLKNFLIDFSNIEESELKEIKLLEEYLVYAVGFGVGEKVLETIKLKLPKEVTEIVGVNILNANNLLSSLSRASSSVNKAASPKLNFDYLIPKLNRLGSGGDSGSSRDRNWSSGSGSGGGFSGGSSGGGSFGGGGGGGRF